MCELKKILKLLAPLEEFEILNNLLQARRKMLIGTHRNNLKSAENDSGRQLTCRLSRDDGNQGWLGRQAVTRNAADRRPE
jgi:hypothetical protein